MAQIHYCDPQSAGINLQSPQSDSTPWTLSLVDFSKKCLSLLYLTITMNFNAESPILMIFYVLQG